MPTSYSSQSHPGNFFFRNFHIITDLHHYLLKPHLKSLAHSSLISDSSKNGDHSGGQYLFSSPESLCHTPKKKKRFLSNQKENQVH